MADDRTRARNRGKAHERATARRLNGERNPSNGRGDEADVSTNWQSVECKNWANLPARVEQALMQAERTAAIRLKTEGVETLPMALIKRRGQWGKNALVVMRLKDFEEYFRNEPAEKVAADVEAGLD